MPFQKTTILSTTETAVGSQVLGQVIPVPTGRLDKVSLYLEPRIADAEAASHIMVQVEVYALDGSVLPYGPPLAQDIRMLSEVVERGFLNFRLQADVPAQVALVLRCTGDEDNYVSWRFVSVPSSSEFLLVSTDGGLSWRQDGTRKFAYAAYSLIPNAVSLDTQTADIQPGTQVTVSDHLEADWELATLDRTKIEGVDPGSTVVIDFGQFVVTLVVDMSGSMTWNDRQGVRFDFLGAFIDDLEAILPPGSGATYSVVKFQSRRIGSMSIAFQVGGSQYAASFLGVRIKRRSDRIPTDQFDPLADTVFDGFAEEFTDTSLTAGTPYYYAAYSYDSAGQYSEGMVDFVLPGALPKAPISAAGFVADEQVLTQFCAALPGVTDTGLRRIVLRWKDPSNTDPLAAYDAFYLVRRDDRFPNSPWDGTCLVPQAGAGPRPLAEATVPTTFPTEASYEFTDFDPSAIVPRQPVLGMTYYYALFTVNSSGIKCYAENARRASATISFVDRIWRKQEPPLNTATAYCFNPPWLPGSEETPPNPPTPIVVLGSTELEVTWTPGSSGPLIPPAARYQLFYDPVKPPVERIDDQGQRTYDAQVVYDGSGTLFVHRDLENDQPCFYALLALDRVGNASTGVQFVATPSASESDVIQPAPPLGFSAEVASSTSARLSWRLPIEPLTSVSAWFGDVVTATASVAFSDLDPRTTAATFELLETTDSAGQPIHSVSTYDPASVVNAASAITFAKAPQDSATTASGTLAATQSMDVRNLISQASTSVYASLYVKNVSTGKVVTKVSSPNVRVAFSNPFGLQVSNDPPQEVNRLTWSPTCDESNKPQYMEETFPGVYVLTGHPFNVVLAATWRGQPLSGAISVQFSVLDKATGLPTSAIKLPQTGADGTALVTLAPTTDETFDRSGSPTGQTEQKTEAIIELPPQSVPGDFILQVEGEYQGYSRTTTMEMHFEPSLNIDMTVSPFAPDGVSVAEQQAFVYLGDPSGPASQKIPVPDLTVVDWQVTPIQAPRNRPLFSRDNVPGTGIKSYTHGGVARNVFFGPGSDVTAPPGISCTDGEMFQISATASVAGMTQTGYGVVELLPSDPRTLNRILLRCTAGQVGAHQFGSTFNAMMIYADGEMQAQFEVVARPEDDGVDTDPTSGKYFRNKVTALGGLVPSIEDGKIITMAVHVTQGSIKPSNILIVTDLTGAAGRTSWARATVKSGLATFKLSVDAGIYGTVSSAETNGLPANPIYDAKGLVWQPAAGILGLTVYIPIDVDGRSVTFVGGGTDLSSDTPPCYVSLEEPLESEPPEA